MLKKFIIASGIFGSIFMGCSPSWAATFAPVQNRGAVSFGTMTTVAVTTTPALLLSTGTQVASSSSTTVNFYSLYPSTSGNQVMIDRMYVEFFNDTSTDVYVGFNSNVSSNSGINYGRRIPPQASWSNDGMLQQYWAVTNTTWTGSGQNGTYPGQQRFVITQEK